VRISGNLGQRRRAKCDLSGRESLDQNHGATANRAEPQGYGSWRSGDASGSGNGRSSSQQLLRQRDQFAAAAAGKVTVMANTHETAGQDVQQETAEKLIRRKGQEALLVVVSRVSEAERDLVIVEGDQAVVRDGDAMGVGAEVAEHLVGSAERRLAIDHPVMAEELTEKALK
jgi:hypothetical protein